MRRQTPFFSILSTILFGLLLGACSGKDSGQADTDVEGGGVPEGGGSPPDVGVAPDVGVDLEAGNSSDAIVDDGASGLSVQASISSATLGDEGCDAGAAAMGANGASCIAPASDSGSGGGRCAGPCCGTCRPSSVQIAFTSGPGAASAHVTITAVELLDSNQAPLEALVASSPQAWDATTGTYVAWDGTLAPSASLKASYALSSPTWSTLGQPYGATYRLSITLAIDGSTVVLVSGPLNRLPFVAT